MVGLGMPVRTDSAWPAGSCSTGSAPASTGRKPSGDTYDSAAGPSVLAKGSTSRIEVPSTTASSGSRASASRTTTAVLPVGTVTIADPPRATAPTQPGGHSPDSGETTTSTPPAGANDTGTRARSSHSPRALRGNGSGVTGRRQCP